MANQSLSQTISYPGFGEGLQIMANDSSGSIKISFRFQSRLEIDKQVHTSTPWQSRMMVRRSRLKFSGFALDPRLRYKVELALSPRDISPASDLVESGYASKIVLDAVVMYSFSKHFEFWVGQTKLPGNLERLVSSQKLQFADRSLVNSNFNIDRDIGAQLHGKFNLGKAVVRPKASVSLGEGRNLVIGNLHGFDYTGRIEFLPFGNFTNKGDYHLSDLEREPKPKLMVAAAYDFNNGATRQRGQLGRFMKDSIGNYLENDLSTIFADLHFKYRGISLLAEYAHKTGERQIIAADGLRYGTGYGYTIQAGYLFKNNWEIASRYTAIQPLGRVYSSIQEGEEYTIGFSRYLIAHNLKIQSDVAYFVPQTGQENLRVRMQIEVSF